MLFYSDNWRNSFNRIQLKLSLILVASFWQFFSSFFFVLFTLFVLNTTHYVECNGEKISHRQEMTNGLKWFIWNIIHTNVSILISIIATCYLHILCILDIHANETCFPWKLSIHKRFLVFSDFKRNFKRFFLVIYKKLDTFRETVISKLIMFFQKKNSMLAHNLF